MISYFKIFLCTLALALISTASAFGSYSMDSDTLKSFNLKLFGEINIGNINDYRPRIALVLSGGGARGLAQVGVLQELEKANIKIDYITGTSIGAILGGLYASGYSGRELDSIVMNTKWDEVFTMSNGADRNEYFLDQKQLNDRSILSFRFNNFKFVMPEAISMGTKYTYFLQNLLWNATYQPFNSFDDLKYKFRAVATDVLSGEPVSFNSGNIVTAVKASSTLPLRYSPIRLDDKILVDGGILANLPTEQALEFSPDIIIGVRSSSPLYAAEDLDKPWNLADQVVSVAMKKFEKNSEKLADYLIIPQINFHKNTDFVGIDSVIAQGKKAARKQIIELSKRIDLYRDSMLTAKLNELYLITKSIPNTKFTSQGLSFSDSIKIQSLNVFQDIEVLKTALKSFLPYKKLMIQYRIENISSDSVIDNMIKVNIIGEKFCTISAVSLCSDYQHITTKIQDSINSSIGRIIQSPEAICNTKELILKQLCGYGYNLCSFDSSATVISNDTLFLQVIIPKITKISISGNTTIGDNLIFRDIIFKIGDFVNSDKLCRSWENIFNTGWFSNVDVKLEMSSDLNSASVFIRVKEIGTQVINLGLRLDEVRKTRLGLDLIQENLFNFGTRINTRFTAGERDLSANFIIEQPRFMDTYLTFKFNTYFNYKKLARYSYNSNLSNGDFWYNAGEDISTQAYGVRISAGSQLEKKGRIGAEVRFEKQRYYDSEMNSSERPSYYSLNTIKFETIFDSEDKADFATKGRVIGLSFETNLLSTSNSRSFSKAIFKYKANHTMGNHTFSPGVFFGFADVSTPLPELFNLGGQDDFFGLLEDQEKGRQIARGQIEWRYKSPFDIFFDTFFSLRYDLGAAWVVPEAIKFSELKHGIGASIAFDTPVGPAKFSLGQSFFFVKEPTKIIYGPLTLYYSIGIRL